MRINRKFCLLAILCWTAFAFAQDNEVAVTVYNNNLALIRDVRTIKLKQGISELKIQDVAEQIEPESVYFISRTAPDKVKILEQNFEYDLVNASKLLQKYLDREISMRTKDSTNYTGSLVNAAGDDIILKEFAGSIKVIKSAAVETITFPKLPEGLITRPTLVWQLDCEQAGKHETELGYLTSGISWHAEYIGVVNDNDTSMQLSAWVSIDNQSGANYQNAKLKLVAGDVRRAILTPRDYPQMEAYMMKAASSAPFEEKAFFEYHLYTLQRPTTLANNQIKQISLFAPATVAVTKKYVLKPGNDKVNVNLEFENRKESGLGEPLPKGKFKVYKNDADEALIFVGEDFIDHTPKNEKVRVYVGDAFDIVGERIQKERRSIEKNSWEEDWEIKLKNRKEETVEVIVVERFGLNWEIVRTSHEFKKKDAHSIEFAIEIAKDREAVVAYTVRYKN